MDRSFLAFVLGPIWLQVFVFTAISRHVHDISFAMFLEFEAGIILIVYASLLLFGLPVFLILKRQNRITNPVSAFLIGAVAGPLPPWVIFFLLGHDLHH